MNMHSRCWRGCVLRALTYKSRWRWWQQRQIEERPSDQRGVPPFKVNSTSLETVHTSRFSILRGSLTIVHQSTDNTGYTHPDHIHAMHNTCLQLCAVYYERDHFQNLIWKSLQHEFIFWWHPGLCGSCMLLHYLRQLMSSCVYLSGLIVNVLHSIHPK